MPSPAISWTPARSSASPRQAFARKASRSPGAFPSASRKTLSSSGEEDDGGGDSDIERAGHPHHRRFSRPKTLTESGLTRPSLCPRAPARLMRRMRQVRQVRLVRHRSDPPGVPSDRASLSSSKVEDFVEAQARGVRPLRFANLHARSRHGVRSPCFPAEADPSFVLPHPGLLPGFGLRERLLGFLSQNLGDEPIVNE